MKLFTAAQMRAADAAAEASGIPTEELMEAAGSAVAEHLLDLFPAVRQVLVLCGKGNNGGDGYVAARHLARAASDLAVTVLELSDEPRTAAAAAARADFTALGAGPGAAERQRSDHMATPPPGAPGAPQPLTAASLRAWLELHGSESTAVIVDALLGSGLDRPLNNGLAALVNLLNDAPVTVLAVDVPTGIIADSPLPPGVHLAADATVQLAGAKVASCFQPARAAFASGHRARSAHLPVADIGIPTEVLDGLSDVRILSDRWCRGFLPRRRADAHKYQAGTVSVVAGSERYLGAAELACRGAWRGGAGLVTLVGAERYAGAWPETIFLQRPAPRPSRDPLHSGSEEVATVPTWPPDGLEPRHAAATVVGPGLEHSSLWLLEPLLAWAPGPVIVDATALEPGVLWPALALAPAGLAGRTVLTPHAGEAARLLAGAPAGLSAQLPPDTVRRPLLGTPVDATAVGSDPLGAARTLAAASGATVVLKGATTVIASAQGELAISLRGHPGMASGGTGDVLAGLLGALTATAAGPREIFGRVCLGVYLHGVAGERAAVRLGDSLIASDLVDELGPAFAALATGGSLSRACCEHESPPAAPT